MYAILKQTDVGLESRIWAELDDDGSPTLHKTKAGAEAAMRSMVPRGEDPARYANLSVCRMAPHYENAANIKD